MLAAFSRRTFFEKPHTPYFETIKLMIQFIAPGSKEARKLIVGFYNVDSG